jgi:hypothetical protein
MRSSLEKGRIVTPSELVDVLVEVTVRLQKSGRSQGILLVIDELGKFLESAVREPERGDIYVLQQLAEATARFRVPGLVLVTVLHQSFERYVAGLRPAIRDEWSKVQGRFEDIAFQEPPEQLLDLVAHAISHASDPLVQSLRQRARLYAERAAELDLVPRGISKPRFIQAMIRCAPLHPLAVLALARLCRKFGQNQRSLFAFLISREPCGFSSFLSQEVSKDHLPFYRLSDLYSYVAEALGNGLAIGESATRWAEVQSALERCVGSSRDEVELIKAVGLLAAVGAYGELKPSKEVTEFAFDDTRQRARQACGKLLRESVLVYRRHSRAFGLWQGSDVDVDARIQEAKQHVIESASLSRRLAALWTPRPLVAKRHSFETGTLRYFAVRFADLPEFSRSFEPDSDADGLVIYCLPATPPEVEQLTELAQSSWVRERPDVVIAIPREIERLREAVRELELLRWVEHNTPELRGDEVARRELHALVTVAEERVAREVRSLFSPGEAAARMTTWFHRGILQSIDTTRSLAHFLSDICNVVYPHTPRVRNELINRRTLSSAAAAARRNLIEAMIARGNEAKLRIVGTPPEMSIYVSVLAATKIHRQEASGYEWGPPESDPGLIEVWKAIEGFFANCELRRRPITELFSLLQKPPFGLKMGVVPILFCAATLAHDTEVALYEDGVFVPELSVQVFERLLRSPERFEIRRFHILGIRTEVFCRFARLLGTTIRPNERSVVSVVRPLYRFFNRLPEYSKRTKTLSPITLAVREALLNAREPDGVLFDDLPRACQFEPFLPANAKSDRIPEFFSALRSALAELQRAYDDLLSGLEKLLFSAFNTNGPKAREVIRFRAQAVSELAVEPKLKAFVHHLSDEQLNDAMWIDAIATLLVGKGPQTWLDTDRARYEIALTGFARNFRHVEVLAHEVGDRLRRGRVPGEVLRIGVTDRLSKDREAVVIIEPPEQVKVAEALIQLEVCLDRLGVATNPKLALAVLATEARRFLSELEKSEVLTTQVAHEEVPRE